MSTSSVRILQQRKLKGNRRSNPNTSSKVDTKKPPAGLEHLFRIGEHFAHFHKNGQGYKAVCPTHPDENPSLSINIGDEGKILLHCHAGCETPDILKEVGLSMADLMPGAAPSDPEPVTSSPQRKCTISYNYKDEDGNILYQVVRFPNKQFRQRSPDGKGGWKWNTQGVRKVLFRVQHVIRSEYVFIVEGEKDAMRLAKQGLCATTNVGGAGEGKWLQEYNHFLAGKHVIILPDNDDAGRQHALEIARNLVGIAASVKIIYLPGLPEKGDVSDWLDAGHTVDELAEIEEKTPPFELHDTPISSREGRTETSNADRLIRRFGSNIRYVVEWDDWIVWDGERWKRDIEGVCIQEKAITVAESLWQEINDSRPSRNGPEYDVWQTAVPQMYSFARASNSAKGVDALITLARSQVPVNVRQLDANDWLLNVANGTIDLRTGELHPHRQEDYITKLCPIAYDPKAKCPRWKEFLSEIFDKDQAVVSFTQRFLGYCLTGDVSEQILPIFWGPGGNGKSLLIEVPAETVLGEDYAGVAPREIFVLSKPGSRHPTEIMTLQGKRFMRSGELDVGTRLSEGLIKHLTGGDAITGRGLYENFTSFSPTHKLVLTTNNKPEVRGREHAIWRRLRIVPFTATFEGDDRDTSLKEKLKAEAQGILAWMVRGCLFWQKNGLREPKAVLLATNEYRKEQDCVGRFVNEHCQQDADMAVPAEELYEAFKKVFPDSDITNTAFGKELGKLGFRKGRIKSGLLKARWARIGLHHNNARTVLKANGVTPEKERNERK